MTRAQARAAGALKRHGTSFTVGGVGHTGVWSVVSTNYAAILLDSAAYLSGAPPWHLVTVGVDDTTAVGQVAVRGSVSYTVRGVLPREAYGQTVAKALVVSR